MVRNIRWVSHNYIKFINRKILWSEAKEIRMNEMALKTSRTYFLGKMLKCMLIYITTK